MKPTLVIMLLVAAAFAVIGCGGSDGSSAATTGSAKAPTSTTSGGAVDGRKDGGESIQGYGSSARAADHDALEHAAFAFFTALAARDYATVCADLFRPNRHQLQIVAKASHLPGGCTGVLKQLLSSSTGINQARKAARGTVTAVRVKGDVAFVLFRPRGGTESYFVMHREGSAWRATSLAPGTPLDAGAAAP